MSELQHIPSNSIRIAQRRKRVVILGTGHLAKELGQLLVFERQNSYEVIGFLDQDRSRVGERLVNPGIIGVLDQLDEIVKRQRVDTIAVCMEDRRGGLPLQALLDCKAKGLEVVDGHHLFEENAGRISIDFLKPSALIFSSGFRRRAIVMGLKRLTDCLASATGLILLAPFLAIVAILIKIDSAGPVIYRQTRVGLRGLPYTLWKFRSMHLGAEENGVQWAAQQDPRVTRVGAWLRKLRIDELPQLANVLQGEMSLVGPRPERPAFVQELRSAVPYYDLRHTVRPGITGWAQIRFRYGASVKDSHVKLQYDLYYVKNLSLALDCRILLGTIRVVLLGAGAR
jgi:sugar transferase (PEP-CTERM system associated)